MGWGEKILTKEEKKEEEEFVFILSNGFDARHHHDHQEDQDDQECPPGMGMFLRALIATNTHLSYFCHAVRLA